MPLIIFSLCFLSHSNLLSWFVIILYHNFVNISSTSLVQICPKYLCIYGFVNNFWTVGAGAHDSPFVRYFSGRRGADPYSVAVWICPRITMKHRLRRYEALATLVWSGNFVAVKRSARKTLRVPKARFIGRSPASRVASQLASCAARRASLKKALACASAFFCVVCPIWMQNRVKPI